MDIKAKKVAFIVLSTDSDSSEEELKEAINNHMSKLKGWRMEKISIITGDEARD